MILLDHLNQIIIFVAEHFVKMLPYLLLTIPLAVALRMSNASRYIRRAFVAQPLVAILLATLVGAFSPFCSCTVIPLIASLLIAGVPLGPVMAFWIASPTMDPEIFLLSLGMLGSDLAIARLVATLIMSLSAGFAAHTLEQRGYFAAGLLREQRQKVDWSPKALIVLVMRRLRHEPAPATVTQPILQTAPATAFISLNAIPIQSQSAASGSAEFIPMMMTAAATSAVPTPPAAALSVNLPQPFSWERLRHETFSAVRLVIKFMLIAFLLEALIMLYVPQATIITWLGAGNPSAILFSALLGIPLYTTNLTALPLIGGLLEQEMLPGAALAFLLSGPATTIPAMSAVYGIAKPRVFAVYFLSILIGSLVLGYGYQLLVSIYPS